MVKKRGKFRISQGYSVKFGVTDLSDDWTKRAGVKRKIYHSVMHGWIVSRRYIARQVSELTNGCSMFHFMILGNAAQPTEDEAAALLDYIILVIAHGKIPDSHLLLSDSKSKWVENPDHLSHLLTHRQAWHASLCVDVLETCAVSKNKKREQPNLPSVLQFVFKDGVDLARDYPRASKLPSGGLAKKSAGIAKKLYTPRSLTSSVCPNVVPSSSAVHSHEGNYFDLSSEDAPVLSVSRSNMYGVASQNSSLAPMACVDENLEPVIVDCPNGGLSAKGEDVLRRAILEGRNIFIQGCAGAGKSTAIRNVIIPALCKRYGCEAGDTSGKLWISSSTAMSAANLDDGSTIHSLSGMRVGAGDVNKLVHELPSAARTRWQTVKAAVIDECGMIGADFFDKFVGVAHAMHPKSGKVCEDLQVILVGDMLQMTACSDWIMKSKSSGVEINRMKANLIFHADVWDRMNFKMFRLSKSHRQADGAYFQALEALSMLVMKHPGDDRGVSEKCPIASPKGQIVRMLSAMFGPLLHEGAGLSEVLQLSCRKDQVQAVNDERMAKNPNPAVHFTAHDVSSSATRDAAVVAGVFATIPTPPEICLKIDAQVILTKNLGGGLMNGSQGVVIGFVHCDGVGSWGIPQKNMSPEKALAFSTHVAGAAFFKYPKVKFVDSDGGEVFKVIYPAEFSPVCAVTGTVLATRTALPLLLAYSLTVHKAQGMTLEKVAMDLSTAFCYGQIYTALSRVRCVEDLVLLNAVNFKCCVLANPVVVAWLAAVKWECIEQFDIWLFLVCLLL